MVKKLGSKLVICGIITFFLASVTYCVGAHSPSSMFLTYNPDVGTLTVDISHQVDDPDSHYVENIEIRKNGELIGTYDYTSQSGSNFDYIYDIDASDGDTL
ncbi:MAG: hypothetical protein ACOC80_11805 [Petrotogales bacterium]